MMARAFLTEQTMLVKNFNAELDIVLKESHLDFDLNLSPLFVNLTTQ